MNDTAEFSFRKFFAKCAIFGFVVSVLVHLSTFTGFNATRQIYGIWLLHLGIFLVFIPMAVSQMLKNEDGWQGANWKDFFKPMPRWARYLVTSLFIYAIVNFGLFFAFTQEGIPDEINGKYVLRQAGRGERPIVRELSEGEYDWENDKILRGFSGHWMMFYLLPALYFSYPTPNKKDDSDSQNLTFSV